MDRIMVIYYIYYVRYLYIITDWIEAALDEHNCVLIGAGHGQV